MVLEKILEHPLDCKIKPVHPKRNQSWIFIRGTDAEAETPILRPPDAKNWLIGKDPDAGKDWRRRGRGQQRMRWLDGITDSMDMIWGKLRKLLMGSLVCCSQWGHKELDMTERLNWTDTRGPTSPHFHLPWPQQPPFYSAYMSLTTLDFSYKWAHPLFVLLLLAYFRKYPIVSPMLLHMAGSSLSLSLFLCTECFFEVLFVMTKMNIIKHLIVSFCLDQLCYWLMMEYC